MRPEPEHTRDVLDRGDQAFWHPVPLDQQLRDVEPVRDLNVFAVEDLSDQEWEAFWATING